MRLKTEQMYDLKLISPTKRQHSQKKKLSALANGQKLKPITQADCKPTVAPESDKRTGHETTI